MVFMAVVKPEFRAFIGPTPAANGWSERSKFALLSILVRIVRRMSANSDKIKDCPPDATEPERRRFLTKLLAMVFGSVAGLVPAGIGLRTFASPLVMPAKKIGAVHVTNLDMLPDDGVPRKFSVVADRQDAFMVYSHIPVGAVYLRRGKDQTVTALNVACPHAGCFVDFLPANARFFCPCHRSSFELDGSIHDPSSPSPRAMDTMEVQVRNGSEVWVKFQNFEAGQKEKVPVA